MSRFIDEQIEQEGRYAYREGKGASACPYSFIQSEFWTTKDYAGFETVRWKLDSWMRGWLEEQKAHRAILPRQGL